MESNFLNAARIKKLKGLREKLPARCSFAKTISENLANQGIVIQPTEIYQMVRGQRTVNEKVVDEMQKLVTEFEEFELTV